MFQSKLFSLAPGDLLAPPYSFKLPMPGTAVFIPNCSCMFQYGNRNGGGRGPVQWENSEIDSNAYSYHIDIALRSFYLWTQQRLLE